MNFKKIIIILLYLGTFIFLSFYNYSLLYIIPIYIVYTILLIVIFKNEINSIFANYNYSLGNVELAEKLFISSIKNNTKNPITYLNYAIMLSHKGKGVEAIKVLEKCEKLKMKPLTKKNIMQTKATCYWIANDIDKGISLLLELIDKFEYANPNTLTTLGYLYILKEDYNNAIKYTKKALLDDENYLLAYDNLGQIEYRRGDIDKAIEYFLKVTEEYNYPDSLYYLGIIYFERNDKEKAKIYLEKTSHCNITALNTITENMIYDALSKL